jgi:rubrerythrin
MRRTSMNKIPTIIIPTMICKKCGHERIPRVEKPLKCPVCGHIPGTQIRIKKEAIPPACKQCEMADLPNIG